MERDVWVKDSEESAVKNDAEENIGEKKEDNTLKEVVSWIRTFVIAITAALLIGNFVIVNASVPSGSMLDTIQLKSRIVAFRLSYLFSDPERFDIVVFKYPDNEKVLYVKRIIGLPGEKVEIRNGRVYINDNPEPLDESFVRDVPYGSYGPYYVPEGSYFMLGDNRNDSEDAREWTNKYVARNKILGKVYFSYYPQIKGIK